MSKTNLDGRHGLMLYVGKNRHEHVEDRLPESGLGLGLVLPASGSGSECPSGFEKRPSAELQQNLSPP